MPKINILIVENDSSFAATLKINLSKWGRVDIVIIRELPTAYEYIQNNKVDLIITKPTLKEEGDGIRFGKDVANGSIALVYITESEDDKYYSEAKKMNLLSFLVRPFDIKTLYAALNLFFDDKGNFLIFSKGKKKIRIKYREINWIRSAGNYCIIRTDTREFSMKSSLTKLKEMYLDHNFIQIHRAFIIRTDKIDDINVKMGSVNIKETKLPIGRKYRKDFFDRIDVI